MIWVGTLELLILYGGIFLITVQTLVMVSSIWSLKIYVSTDNYTVCQRANIISPKSLVFTVCILLRYCLQDTHFDVRTLLLFAIWRIVFNQLEMFLVEGNYRFSMEMTVYCQLDSICHTENVWKAHTNYGLSEERTLPEIMIELLSGLIKSESYLIGVLPSPWVNSCTKKIREGKREVLNNV